MTGHSNQQTIPALIPASTTPACHASRENRVEAMGAPDREQVEGAAAADVHGVHAENEVPQSGVARSPEQVQVMGLGPPDEGLVEPERVALGVAACRPDEADPGQALSSRIEDDLVEPLPVGFLWVIGEASAAERDDLALHRIPPPFRR